MLTQKKEGFILDYFATGKPAESYMKHYSCKSLAVAAAAATRLLKNVNVQERLQELRDKSESDKVMPIRERKERLSEIARARMTDFMTCSADGVWMHDIGQETLNSAALKRVETTTMPFKKGKEDFEVILTKVELINPIQAITELNKMDKVYDDAPKGNIYNDYRGATIKVIYEDDIERQKLIEGEKVE